MIHVPFTPRAIRLIALTCLAFGQASHCHGWAGTEIVATKGQPVAARSSWPKGVADFLNDPTRGTGWNDFFSEWPNDVNHYELAIKNTGDLNRIIKKFSEIKSKERFINLSPMKEPRGLGWVTNLPEGNGIAAIFSIGDQRRIDDWHRRLPNGVFGNETFNKPPVAVPPTLTIFVQNPAVDLKRLEVRAGIKVTPGFIPTVFQMRSDDAPRRAEPKLPASADAKTKESFAAIKDFLMRREQASAEKKGR